MPEFTSPGVYVEEISFTSRPIECLPVDAALFVGRLPDGSHDAIRGPFVDLAEFEQACGPVDVATPDYLRRAVAAFFANGGRKLHIAVVDAEGESEPDAADYATALQASLESTDIGLVAAPGASTLADGAAIEDVLLAHVASPDLGRFLLLDPPSGLDIAGIRAWRSRFDSPRAATYYPWIVADGMPQPPSGFLCGVYAATDRQRGVHVAPANLELKGADGFERPLTHVENELLNPLGINCLREFPGRGLRVWGARTLSSDPEWKYVNVRRLIDQLQRSLCRGLEWVATERQDESLWANVRAVAGDFLMQEWRNGALVGDKPQTAWFVRCDRETMTQADIDAGKLVCMIGVAPARPTEFVTFRIVLATLPAVE